jgi:hypothetical protein
MKTIESEYEAEQLNREVNIVPVVGEGTASVRILVTEIFKSSNKSLPERVKAQIMLMKDGVPIRPLVQLIEKTRDEVLTACSEWLTEELYHTGQEK